MYKGRKIGVVVPCHNEETQVGKVVDTMPKFVDKIVLVDDKSKDGTVAVMKRLKKKGNGKRLKIIEHKANKGVGGAISNGYAWCRDHDIDVAVVMAGDGQMDPADLPAILDPVVEGRADYAKGNRFISGEAFKKIPKIRYFGNAAMTMMTKIASGYWHVTDAQSGYTAISAETLKLIPVEEIYPRYGMPNDLLVTLNIYGARVVDVPVNPLYGVGERSGMVIHRTIPSLISLMTRLFLKRMTLKYIVRDFHPLIFFYVIGLALSLVAIPLAVRMLYIWLWLGDSVTPVNALGTGFAIVMALQFLLFAMWFDMDYNRLLNPGR
jgi:glycosyltransferase involved in cell wall biosynthesis